MKKNFLKKIFKNSLMLFVIFLPTIIFAAGGTAGSSGLVTCDGPNCTFAKFIDMIEKVMTFIIMLGIAFSAIVFAYAGWLYMTSGGDSGKVSKAHELFEKVLWGFLIALGAFLIVQLVAKGLGVTRNI